MFQLCRIRHDLLRLPVKISVQAVRNTALHPGQDGQEAAALIRLAVPDSADAELLRAILDSAAAQEGLDTEGLLAILEPMKVYNRATTLLRADGMHFSFNRRLEGEEVEAAREIALRDLDEYIGVLVTQPEIRARLAEATADYLRTMDDEGHARQQKLRAMDEELTRLWYKPCRTPYLTVQ